jgi:hypothetical protein
MCVKSNAQGTGTISTVNIIQAPAGSLVPDVVMDNTGILHMVYALDQNAYYIRSADNGATFSSPVKVNSTGTVEFKMGERGPKLAVGIDGVIHVAWMDHWSSGVNVFARYTRSLDGGNTFEPLKTVSATPGVDGVTVAADGFSHVFIFWHTLVPPQTQIPEATWLHLSRSADNGVSFTSDANVVINNHSGLACSMCMTRARFGTDDNIYLAFRSAVNNIRDFYVLKGNPADNDFTAIRVNTDNWYIQYCPMVGPELEISNSGRQYCAFMSSNHVYWAVSDSNITAFTQHIATPLNEPDEIFPTAIANNSGKVLFLWQVGPMSVSDSATVKWALYNTDGTFTGQQATVGRTFSGTKSTAYVGTDDNFYIVINSDDLTSLPPVRNLPEVSVFPNPANDFLRLTGIGRNTILMLYDGSGKQILGKEISSNTTLDTRLLSPGVYTLVLEGNKIRIFKKILIAR